MCREYVILIIVGLKSPHISKYKGLIKKKNELSVPKGARSFKNKVLW